MILLVHQFSQVLNFDLSICRASLCIGEYDVQHNKVIVRTVKVSLIKSARKHQNCCTCRGIADQQQKLKSHP